MWFHKSSPHTERRPEADSRQLDELREAVRKLSERVSDLEGEEFKLSELRRQARNAVRSLERAAQNAQEAHQGTNGGRPRVEVGVPPIEAPGPRRNY